MRIAIYGAGGVGGYFGGRLAEAGHDVTFIARGDHLRALQTDGLHLDSIAGDAALSGVQATDDPAAVGPVDAVLLGVKAWQVSEVASTLAPMLGEDTMVVPLQNGVDAPRQLAGAIGERHVLPGLCYIISYLDEPGRVRHEAVEPQITFGEQGGRRTERAERLLSAFEDADGLTAKLSDDIEAALWRKFLMMAPGSSVAALARVPIGRWRGVMETRRLFKAAMHEVLSVAQARDVALAPAAADDVARFIDRMDPGATFSMQRDVMEGRPSEVEALCGAVVEMGGPAGVDVPAFTFMHAALLPQEQRAREAG